MQRERDYKAEIKRLEVIMAKESTDGVASVHLARHDSLVNRPDSKRFEARLKRMSSSVDGTEPAPEDATGSLDQSVRLAKVAGCYQTIGTSCTRFLPLLRPFLTPVVDAIPRSTASNQDELISRFVARRDKELKRLESDQRCSLDVHNCSPDPAQQHRRRMGRPQPPSGADIRRLTEPSHAQGQAASEMRLPQSEQESSDSVVQSTSAKSSCVEIPMLLRTAVDEPVSPADHRGRGPRKLRQPDDSLVKTSEVSSAVGDLEGHPQATLKLHESSATGYPQYRPSRRGRSYSFDIGDDEQLSLRRTSQDSAPKPPLQHKSQPKTSPPPQSPSGNDPSHERLPTDHSALGALGNKTVDSGANTRAVGVLDHSSPEIAVPSIRPSKSTSSVIWIGYTIARPDDPDGFWESGRAQRSGAPRPDEHQGCPAGLRLSGGDNIPQVTLEPGASSGGNYSASVMG
jgi:hypothetical protein